MAQYMFLIYGDEAAFSETPPSPEQWQEMMAAHMAFQSGVNDNGGTILGGEALAPTTTATTVRPSPEGEALVTDGPFAETKEALGGYYLVEAEDLDAALGFAKTLPTTGCVEVRPVVPTNAPE